MVFSCACVCVCVALDEVVMTEIMFRCRDPCCTRFDEFTKEIKRFFDHWSASTIQEAVGE